MESSQNNTKTEYTPNEYVSYGTSGVCQIVSVEQRSFDGEHEESYYKLRPVGNGNSTYYVPVERAADRLRPLLTKEQIYGLIDEMADVDFRKQNGAATAGNGVASFRISCTVTITRK